MKPNQQPITGCGDGDVAPYVFLCGDPERVPKISSSWSTVREVCRIREYVIHTGVLEGIDMTVASTGIGAPSTAVVMEELVKLGAHTFIRVGNSGAISPDVELGDYVISSASVRDDGTSTAYVQSTYPASAHYQVTHALVSAASDANAAHHVGISWSTDAFYARNKVMLPGGGVGSMCAKGYTRSGMNEMVEDLRNANVLNIEMESGIIFTLANLYGLRAGCICTVSDRCPWPGPGQDMISLDRNIQGAIAVALTAMTSLATSGS